MESGVRLSKCLCCCRCCGKVTSYRCYDCNDKVCENCSCEVLKIVDDKGFPTLPDIRICFTCEGKNIKGSEE